MESTGIESLDSTDRGKLQEMVKDMCCSPWGCKELDTTKQMNNNVYMGVCPLLGLL